MAVHRNQARAAHHQATQQPAATEISETMGNHKEIYNRAATKKRPQKF